MKHVIITGATSFIGVALSRRLLREGLSVTAVCRPDSVNIKNLANSANLKIVEADMAGYSKLDRLIKQGCNYFFQLAWNGTRGLERDSKDQQTTNLYRSIDALNAVLRLGCECVITAGSQAEYGLHDGLISETTECNPVSEYGKKKLEFYEAATRLCHPKNLRVIEPRFFSLYGPGDYLDTMVISILKKMLNNEDCPLTRGIQIWDFLFIEDAVDALIALMSPSCESGVYNLGSGDARPLKHFIEEMLAICGSKSRLLFGDVPYPNSGMVNVQPDISKLRSATGWLPMTTFDDGIRKVIMDLVGNN